MERDLDTLIFLYCNLGFSALLLGALAYFKWGQGIKIGRIDSNNWDNEDYLKWYASLYNNAKEGVNEDTLKHMEHVLDITENYYRVYWCNKYTRGKKYYE